MISRMTNEHIKQIEKDLWEAADELRANSKLTAAEYKDPVLGLILLRYAQNKFEEAKEYISENTAVNPRTGKKATKDDFLAAGLLFLKTESQFDYLVNLPESENVAEAVNNAMKLIEEDYKDLQGVLPKNYQDFDLDLLRSLIRLFNTDAIKNISGDVFGRIYEFFLMKFSMSGAGAQEGGEFFTPPSLVQLIVNYIEPDHGIIHDPACGSGGMFVQTGHFIKNHTNKQINEAITAYGTELKSNNVRLAKMNLAIHGIEGKIIESNSFYTNPHELTGKCDFVMANPPFNVKKIDKSKEYVKTDPRLFEDIGIPKADNGNYMWIQYFHAYLNSKGRAGFVMASSATDAGNTEKAIRKKLIETKDVDVIVSVGNNFFYTRSLPCHLWFFDKGKSKRNKDKILMIDARNTFRVVNSTINDFSEGQQLNLSTIVKLYRGNNDAVNLAIEEHKNSIKQNFKKVNKHYTNYAKLLKELSKELKNDSLLIDVNIDFEAFNTIDEANNICEIYLKPSVKADEYLKSLEKEIEKINSEVKAKKLDKKLAKAKSKPLRDKLNKLSRPLKDYQALVNDYLKNLKQRIGDWKDLQEYFPENEYNDVEGLCKIVDLEEVKENDYSLTPGRYVGYSIQIDENFDYKSRMQEIHSELAELNTEANELMNQIQASSSLILKSKKS